MLLALEKVYQILADTHNFHFTVIRPPFSGLETFDHGIRKQLIPDFDFCAFAQQLLEKTPANTFVLTQDEFQCSYMVFKLPDVADTVYLCGPVIRSPMTAETEKQIRKHYGEESLQQILAVYQTIRVEYDTHALSFILELYAKVYPEAAVHCQEFSGFLPNPLLNPDYTGTDLQSHTRLDDQLLSQKYLQELRLMGAISCGHTKQALLLLSELERYQVPQILGNASVNLKNQLLGVNAICKFAIASTQTVHPAYIEKIYETYVMKVDQVHTIRDMSALISQMICAYCECIQEHSLCRYSPLIRRVVNHIHLHPEQPLSLGQLALMCNVNASYLSNLFRTEVGTPLSAYINRRRIDLSIPLLRYSDLSIAQIGTQVGFQDENYYARVFRKYKGTSPTDYRKQGKV